MDETDAPQPKKKLSRNDYTIGWICALSIELAASAGMLDEVHPDIGLARGDKNMYTLGAVAGHNIVIACLPEGSMGIVPAATVASNMLRSFPRIRFGLMVGIGGGAPARRARPSEDIRLGDVVVSVPLKELGGVVKYDRGKVVAGGEFEHTGLLNMPPAALTNAVSKLRSIHETKRTAVPRYVESMIKGVMAAEDANPEFEDQYRCPDIKYDQLFEAEYEHVEQKASEPDFDKEWEFEGGEEQAQEEEEEEEEEDDDEPLSDEDEDAVPLPCPHCDKTRLIPRKPRKVPGPVIHYGTIASADQVMRHAQTRDKIRKKFGVLCFEMEAAGLMNDFPCLVIRGICDYSDTHKHKIWQRYAAATAAAYAKELLQVVLRDEIELSEDALQVLERVQKGIDNIGEGVEYLMKDRQQQNREIILNWLDSDTHTKRFIDSYEKWQPSTVQKLLGSDQYSDWSNGDSQTLWCHGIAGGGKTIFASVVVDSLKAAQINKPSRKSRAGVVCLFIEYERQKEQTVRSLTAAILRQLSEQCEMLPESVIDLFEQYGSTIAHTRFEDISLALTNVMKQFPQVYLIVDALDECTENTRRELLAHLSDQQRKSGLKILATSRSTIDFQKDFGASEEMEIKADVLDVKTVLDLLIDRSDSLVRTNKALRHRVTESIAVAVDGMFLLVQPFLDSIIGERSRGHIEDALHTLMESPDKLSTVYQSALNRIGGQKPGDRKLAHRMLSWVVQSKRPLTRREFLHALAVKAGNLTFKRDYIIHDLDGAVALCAGLVVINRKSDTVQLMHHTTRAYFEDPAHRPEWMGDAEEMIASACVTYVSYTVFEDGPCESDEDFDDRLFDFPFLTYAAQHWGNHARDAGAQTTTMEDLALEFLRDEAKLASANQAMQVTDRRYRGYSSRYDEGMTGLHMVASFGLANLTRHLLSDNGYADVRDQDGRTALHKAAENGHNDVVLALLEHGTDFDAQEDTFDQTPLHLAALNGHKAVVQTLLDHRASPNIKDDDGWMAIHVAAWTGNEEVMKVLLERTEVDARTDDSLTALHCAAAQGHLNIAHLLIRAGADVDAKDKDEWTPLHWAAKKRHDIMRPRMLSLKDESSTLLRQFYEFREELNQLVLHEGLSTVKKTLDFWQNKLAWLPAGIQLNIEGGAGYGEIMAALQMTSNMQNLVLPWPIWGDIWGDICDDAMDDKKGTRRDGKDKPLAPTQFIFAIQDELTAMHCSTECGHEAVARLLLKSGAGIEKRCMAGIEVQWLWRPKVYMTALQLAAFSGHEAMVRLLLKQGADIHRRTASTEGGGSTTSPRAQFTALHCGVISSSEEVVQLLLDHGADIQESCPFGFLNVSCRVTPLHVAVMLGHLNQVQLLLANGANVDAPGQAAVSSTVEYLETRKGTEDLRDMGAEEGLLPARTIVTSLHLSALLGRDDIMAALLENGAAVDGQASVWIGTAEFSLSALHLVALRRRESAVRLLLENKADPGQRMSVTNELEDVHTRVEMSTLHFVSFFRGGRIPEMLLEAGADVNESLELDVSGWRTLRPREEKREREGSDHDDESEAESEKRNSKDFWDRILARTAKNFTALVGDELSEMPILGAIVQGDDEEEPDDVVYHLHARLTALSLATLRNNDEVVNLFLEKGAAVDAESYVSVNEVHISFVALHLACLNASKDVALTLLKPGADVHAVMTIEFDEILQIRASALHLAAVSGNEDLVRLLWDNGSEVDEKCLVNRDPANTLNALHLAALWGRYEVARVLLEYGADTTQMCRLKLDSGLDIAMTVVHLAALSGNMVLVDHLLTTDCDACVSAKLDCYKLRAEFTVLHLAALWGEESIVDELLRNGQDVHAKCLVEVESRLRIDLPAVHLASFAGSVEVLGKLIEVGADPRQRVLIQSDEIRTELTVLHVAAIARQREVVEFLLGTPEIDIHAIIEADLYGMHVSFTLLHLVAFWRVKMAALLLEKGFAPNARFVIDGEETHTELSALHLAVLLKKKRLLLTLLDSGADADAKAQIITDDVNVELTALHLAVAWRSKDMVQMLTSTDPLALEENPWLDADSDASESDTNSSYASSYSRRSWSRSSISSSGYFSASRSRSTSRTRREFRKRSRSSLAARPRPTRRGRSRPRRRPRVRSLDRAPSPPPAPITTRPKSPDNAASRLKEMVEKLVAERPRSRLSKIPYGSTIAGVAAAMGVLMGLKRRRRAQGRADTRPRARARSVSTVYPRRAATDGQPPPTTQPSSRTSVADANALLLLNVGDFRIQLTSLHIATALSRKPSMMQLLLKNTTDYNPVLKAERAEGDFLELTPLHLAVLRRSKESVQSLVKDGADVEALVRFQVFNFNAEVSSLQISAAMPPHWDIAQFLLGHRASAEARHPFGFKRTFQTDVPFLLLLAFSRQNEIADLAEKGVALKAKAPASIQVWFHSDVSAAEMTLGQQDEQMKNLFSHYVQDPEFGLRDYEPWLRKSAFLMVSAMANERVLDIALTGITDIDAAMTVNVRVRADAIFPILLQANVDAAVDIDLEATLSGLHVAASLGNLSVTSLLLHRGASVENRCTITAGDILRAELSVIHMAALWRRTSMILSLLVKGAKVDSIAQIYMDRTVPAKVLVPHLVVILGHERISRFLTRGDDNNININIQAELAPMHVTVLTGDTASTVMLLEHHEKTVDALCTIRLRAKTTSSHADVDVQGHFTPLHLAIWAGHTNLVETMLKRGAHIETPVQVGGTASFERGARVTRKIQVSGTALHLAAGLGKEDIVRVLIDNGAQINAKSQDGRTAQEWAEDRGHEGVVQILAQAGDGKTERRRFREKWHDIFAKAGPNGPSNEDGQSLERVDTGSGSSSQVKTYRQEGLGNVFTRWIVQKVKEKQEKLDKLKPDEESKNYIDEEID